MLHTISLLTSKDHFSNYILITDNQLIYNQGPLFKLHISYRPSTYLHFNMGRHGKVPCRNMILLWVKKRPVDQFSFQTPGDVRAIQTPDNAEALLGLAIMNRLCCSTSKHGVGLACQIAVCHG